MKTNSVVKPMKTGNLGIYIHIPFCRSKCPYCDFYSIITGKNGGSERKNAYIDALFKDADEFFTQNRSKIADLCKNDGNLSIFIGGGTPNTLDFTQIGSITGYFVKKIDEIFTQTILKEPDLCKKVKSVMENCEISMEMNPFLHDYDEIVAFCVKIKEVGVNRLSIGAQSFDNRILKSLGRLHREEDIVKTVKAARQAGFENISLDLMFGIPGQGIGSWLDTVKKAVSLPVTHISMYSLEFMDGTVFYELLNAGKMKETEPAFDREMYHSAIHILREAGFEQYEISNFARTATGECGKEHNTCEGAEKNAYSDYRSKHNIKYWNFDEYAGFGPSAHSLIIKDGIAGRYVNVPDLDAYIKNPLEKECYEELDKDGQASEYAFTALRMNRGIDLDEFKERFGKGFFERFPDAEKELKRFADGGYAVLTEKQLRLTEKGFDISNRIFELFV